MPDDAVDAIDAFGEGALRSEPPTVRERLRSDLRLRVVPGDGATATCRFETEHTTAPETLRGRGSFVETIVDGIDARFEAWGIDPPEAYRYLNQGESPALQGERESDTPRYKPRSTLIPGYPL